MDDNQKLLMLDWIYDILSEKLNLIRNVRIALEAAPPLNHKLYPMMDKNLLSQVGSLDHQWTENTDAAYKLEKELSGIIRKIVAEYDLYG